MTFFTTQDNVCIIRIKDSYTVIAKLLKKELNKEAQCCEFWYVRIRINLPDPDSNYNSNSDPTICFLHTKNSSGS